MKKFSCSWLLLAAVAVVGCGKSDSGAAPTTNTAATAAGTQGTVAATPAGTPTSVVTEGAGTAPGEVVALFLDSLRRGDETAANSVLTTQAQTELAKTDYVIQPLGTPEGKYKIGRIGFVDGDTTTGLVECLWSEPSPVAGEQPIEMDIVCEVHKEAQGWRISGLAVKMAGTEETLVLDFEDAKSLQQALEGASQSAPAQVAGGQPAADASGSVTLPQLPAAPNANMQTSLPQLPTGTMPTGAMPAGQFAPGQVPNVQLPALPTQIALPPSESVNR